MRNEKRVIRRPERELSCAPAVPQGSCADGRFPRRTSTRGPSGSSYAPPAATSPVGGYAFTLYCSYRYYKLKRCSRKNNVANKVGKVKFKGTMTMAPMARARLITLRNIRNYKT